MGQVHPWESRSRAGQHVHLTADHMSFNHATFIFSLLLSAVLWCQGLARCLFAFWSCPAKKSSGGRPCPFSLIVQLPTTSVESGRQRLVIIFFLFFGIRTAGWWRVSCVCVSLPRAWTSIHTHWTDGKFYSNSLISRAQQGGGGTRVSFDMPPSATHQLGRNVRNISWRFFSFLFSHQLKK